MTTITKQPHKIHLVPETEDVTVVPPHKRFDQEIRKSSMPTPGRTFPPEEDRSEEGEEAEKMKKDRKCFCIFHRKPWFVLGWVMAPDWEDAMRQAVMKYDKWPHFLKREMLHAAPSMYQGT